MTVKFQGDLAILPRNEYKALKALADEAKEDQGTARIVDREMRKVDAGLPIFPIEVVDRFTNGENPVRVIRQWRDMTQDELAVGVGIPQGYLSDIETGKRKGPLELHRKLARALGVPLDLLAGVAVSQEAADPQRIQRRRQVIARVKRTHK